MLRFRHPIMRPTLDFVAPVPGGLFIPEMGTRAGRKLCTNGRLTRGLDLASARGQHHVDYDQRGGSLNTHSVVPPAGLSISGVKLDEAELSGPPPPATTATYCSPWTL